MVSQQSLQSELVDDVVSPNLEALKKMIFHTPLSNTTKLEQLKNELYAGQYQVQSHLLAAKLIEHLHPFEELEMA